MDVVINELIYHHEQGNIDTQFTVEQLKLLSVVSEAIKKFNEIGYNVVLLSNQPWIANEYMTDETSDKIRRKMKWE